MLIAALVLVSVAFAVTLGILLFGNRPSVGPGATPSLKSGPDLEPRLRQLETDLDKKRRELEEQKSQVGELKSELKTTKRKLFEQKEGEKSNRDFAKAREEEERSASVQLVNTRAELSSALVELQRLRAETETKGRRTAPQQTSPLTVVAPAPVVSVEPLATGEAGAPVAAPLIEAPRKERERPTRVIRELNDADREKMERLEHEAVRSKAKASELDREVKRAKGRAETAWRIVTQVRNEAELIRDKFKALEKRMNRILLERDLLRRAIKDLEKRAGIVAERTELTPDEIAASDQKVEDQHAQERAKHAEREAAAASAAETLQQREDAANEAAAVSTESAAPVATEAALTDDKPAQA